VRYDIRIYLSLGGKGVISLRNITVLTVLVTCTTVIYLPYNRKKYKNTNSIFFDLTINSKEPELLRTARIYTVLFSIVTSCSLISNNKHLRGLQFVDEDRILLLNDGNHLPDSTVLYQHTIHDALLSSTH
jgi:hypothetical protein